MKNALILSALLLIGCVEPGPQIDSGLTLLIGQDIHAAIDRLGYPASQREIAGDTVYTWSTDRRTTMTLPTTHTTTGNVDGTPFYATTTGTEDIPLHFHCAIQIATDGVGKIKRYEWEGNRGGCGRYARRLGR